MIAGSDIVEFIAQLEGPYRWYAIGAVLVIITALVTRFIFKTLKWFLIIVAIAIIAGTIANYFVDLADVLAGDLATQVKQIPLSNTD